MVNPCSICPSAKQVARRVCCEFSIVKMLWLVSIFSVPLFFSSCVHEDGAKVRAQTDCEKRIDEMRKAYEEMQLRVDELQARVEDAEARVRAQNKE